ncbi:hypothetical protein ACQ4PT_042045 [Festuca glaucescens]
MGECGGSEYRCWEELLPDALGLVFRNLPLQEVLTVVPRVCKSWGRVVSGPYCWQQIDIEEWSLQKQSQPEQLVRMVEMLLRRSAGSCRRLSVSGLPCDPPLLLHRRPYTGSEDAGDPTERDQRRRRGDRGAEAAQPDVPGHQQLHQDRGARAGGHDEARAIARTMPRLRHLEVGYMLVTTEAILEVLARCRDLEFVDLRGCWAVDERFLQERHPGLNFLGPGVDDCFENSYWEECSDDDDDDDVYSWELMDDDEYYAVVGSDDDDEAVWDDGQGIENLEVRFYGGGFNESYAGFDWPASP